MKVFQIIKEGAKKFWKNPILGIPTLLQIIANYIPIIIVSVVLALITGVSVISVILNPETISDDILNKIILWVSILLFILVGLLLIVNSFFEGMLLGMLKHGKRKLDFDSGGKFWARIFCFDLMFGIYMLISAIIIIVTSILTSISMWFAIIPILLAIVFLISIPLFLLGAYYIVLNDLKVKEALRKSCKVVWKHYFKFLGLLLLLILITATIILLLGWIQVVGIILINLLSMTYLKICFYLFASSED